MPQDDVGDERLPSLWRRLCLHKVPGDLARWCRRISFLARLHRVHYDLLGLRFRVAGIEPFAPVLASMREITV
jgi:hypothetical protein